MNLYQNSTPISTMKTTENLKPKMVAPKQLQNCGGTQDFIKYSFSTNKANGRETNRQKT